jgi:hypothetical protein
MWRLRQFQRKDLKKIGVLNNFNRKFLKCGVYANFKGNILKLGVLNNFKRKFLNCGVYANFSGRIQKNLEF